MQSCAVLITCFNRKQKTLECLTRLYGQKELGESFRLDIYLVDDDSKDGTSEAVRAMYPDVKVIAGSGSLYWNGGMRLAWKTALDSGRDYDFFLWVNDDSFLYDDAIARIISDYDQLKDNGETPGAIAGTMIDPVKRVPTYGGRMSSSAVFLHHCGPVLQPDDKPKHCRFINGNLKSLGILSDAYTHAMGDNDYGFRLLDAGFSCWIGSGVFGECPRNPVEGSYLDKKLPMEKRLALMRRPSQLNPLHEWIHFTRLYGGALWFIPCLKYWLIWTFPRIWIWLKSS